MLVEASAETLAPELHYIVTDQAGTPRELCTEAGDIEWRGEQSLWGEHHKWRLSIQQKSKHKKYLEDAANDPVNCDLRYQGQVFDFETGLYYNRHRYYDPETCQYLSPDPIGMTGGLRPQAYVHNPMEWVDPLGLTSCELSSAMEKNGTPRPDDSAAHHVVGETSKGADPARKVLAKHDIDINGADNGVFLPNRNNTSDMPGILHNGRHPNDYLKTVNDRIVGADAFGGKQGVLDELSAMRSTLSSADLNSSWNTVLN